MISTILILILFDSSRYSFEMKTKSAAAKTETSNVEEAPSNCPFDFERCRKALTALKKIISNAQQGHKQLLDEATGISLYLHVHKIPRCTYLRLSSQLPHPFTQNETRDVCLFVRDDDVNGREFEATIRRYKSIIEQFKLPFHVDIMTLKQLNQVSSVGFAMTNSGLFVFQELVPYEAKRKLCARYDLFLADRRIITSLMRGQLLGKHFRHHGKMPLGINVFNTDFKQRLLSLCSSTFGRMAGSGPLFSMQFTTLQQSVDHGIENLKMICKTIEKEFPGGWSNVAHAYLYGKNLQSLPIYYSTHGKNEVKQINLPLREKQDLTEIGELSTLDKNLNVIVEPDGNVHLTKRTKLNKNFQAKKPRKRLQKTWLKGVEQPHRRTTKRQKKTKTTAADDLEPEVNGNGAAVVDTAFVQRVAQTRLAKKSEKLKHVEQSFANKPAPRAEKRKRLLAVVKQTMQEKDNGGVPTLADVDEERKIKSGGRSKKRVRLQVWSTAVLRFVLFVVLIGK